MRRSEEPLAERDAIRADVAAAYHRDVHPADPEPMRDLDLGQRAIVLEPRRAQPQRAILDQRSSRRSGWACQRRSLQPGPPGDGCGTRAPRDARTGGPARAAVPPWLPHALREARPLPTRTRDLAGVAGGDRCRRGAATSSGLGRAGADRDCVLWMQTRGGRQNRPRRSTRRNRRARDFFRPSRPLWGTLRGWPVSRILFRGFPLRWPFLWAHRRRCARAANPGLSG